MRVRSIRSKIIGTPTVRSCRSLCSVMMSIQEKCFCFLKFLHLITNYSFHARFRKEAHCHLFTHVNILHFAFPDLSSASSSTTEFTFPWKSFASSLEPQSTWLCVFSVSNTPDLARYYQSLHDLNQM